MILRNFRIALAFSGMRGTATQEGIEGPTGFNGKHSIATKTSYALDTPLEEVVTYGDVASEYKGTDIIIGGGTTPVNERDYKLAKEISENIQFVSAKMIRKQTDNMVTHDFIKTMKNNTETNITITEIGLVGGFSNGSGTTYNMLYTREVLEEPIVVPAGGYFTIQTGLKFSI